MHINPIFCALLAWFVWHQDPPFLTKSGRSECKKLIFSPTEGAHLFSPASSQIALPALSLMWRGECLNIVSRLEINCLSAVSVCALWVSRLLSVVCLWCVRCFMEVKKPFSRSQLALLKGRKKTLTSFCPVK
jgi:hypothetical protein